MISTVKRRTKSMSKKPNNTYIGSEKVWYCGVLRSSWIFIISDCAMGKFSLLGSINSIKSACGNSSFFESDVEFT